MGKELEKEKTVIIDDPMTPVPLNQRQHWTAPAFIFGGLEFSVTLLMIGSTLIGAFGLKGIIPVVLFTFICLTWVGNAISGYMGAKTGLSSSVIAKQGFGDKQAKFIIALVIGVISMGWWAVQTSVTGNAFCAVLGIDYTVNRTAWMITTIVAGILFAIPSVIGYSSMKWTDYFAVPGGILLCIVGIYLALKNIGWSNIISYEGSGEISFAAGVTMILGMNGQLDVKLPEEYVNCFKEKVDWKYLPVMGEYKLYGDTTVELDGCGTTAYGFLEQPEEKFLFTGTVIPKEANDSFGILLKSDWEASGCLFLEFDVAMQRVSLLSLPMGVDPFWEQSCQAVPKATEPGPDGVRVAEKTFEIKDGQAIDVKISVDHDMVEVFVGEQVAFTYRIFRKPEYELGLLAQDAKVEFANIAIRK